MVLRCKGTEVALGALVSTYWCALYLFERFVDG